MAAGAERRSRLLRSPCVTPASGRSDRCVECGGELDVAAAGWRAYLLEGDGVDEPEILLYCPDCAYKEFGPPRKRSANDEPPPN